MPPDPKAEGIRAAFDAAAFDERTADERGFAARFEREFKPLLKAGVEFNLGVRDARLRRRRIAKGIAIAAAIAIVPAIVLLNAATSEELRKFTLYGIVLAAVLVYRWAVRKRPDEEDPNHAKVIEAVLGQFGCGVARTTAAARAVPSVAPVAPAYTRISVLDEYVVGRFDDRIPFQALRVTTTRKEGKSTKTTFKGWYLRVDLPFAFAGTTVIRDFGAEHRVKDGAALQEVRLESAEFAKRFTVTSDDQVEARLILAPDVMQHLIDETDRLDPQKWGWSPAGRLLLAFRGSHAHVWIPSRATALSDWQPLDPGRLIEDVHEAFAELAEIRAFLRDIDAIAESEGFRAQAAKNGRAA